MKKKILASILTLIFIISIGTMVMADNAVVNEYKKMVDGLTINMIWVGVVIIISIVGMVMLTKLRKKEKIKPVPYKVMMVILTIVLIAFIIYEGKVIWDYAGIKPAYDYLVKATG